MAVYQIGTTIYVEASYGQATPTAFWYGGSRYFLTSTGLWIREWADARGLIRREEANVRFARGLAPFAVPTTLRLRPIEIWPRPLGGRILSHHINARRWVRVLAYLNETGALEVPLLDADGLPWFGTSVPPRCVMRRSSDINSDHVGAPEVSGLSWQDIGIGLTPGGPFDSAKRTFTTTAQATWTLKVLTDPVAHWILRLETAFQGTGANHTFLVDLHGEGYGEHASATREVGGAGSTGHWKSELMWAQQAFGDVTDAALLSQMKASVGSLDVANDPEPGTSPGTLYFTTGANQGLSTGTALYTKLPCVSVFGNATLGAYASSDPTTWEPETWGMGCSGISTAALTDSGAERAYFSEVFKDSGSGHYAVRVYNVGANSSGAAPSAALDRTFFAFATGM